MRIVPLSLLGVFVAPALAFAAGEESTQPKTTFTTDKCETGLVWDSKQNKCVAPKDSLLDDDELYQTARELAYVGRLQDAQDVLRQMSDPEDDRVLTYMGFTNRKLGKMNVAMTFYQKALDKNPNNLLARSYMGQGHVTDGDLDLAWAQLQEIRTRGGDGTWAATSLENAIATGVTYNY